MTPRWVSILSYLERRNMHVVKSCVHVQSYEYHQYIVVIDQFQMLIIYTAAAQSVSWINTAYNLPVCHSVWPWLSQYNWYSTDNHTSLVTFISESEVSHSSVRMELEVTRPVSASQLPHCGAKDFTLWKHRQRYIIKETNRNFRKGLE